MRIVVQIPCLNEEATIGSVIRDIREATSGLGDVLILVIDDGSTDDTSRVALEAGADLIAHHRVNRGSPVRT